MRRLLKTLGIALGVLVVIAIAVPLIASVVIDPNAYRDQIARAVEERTGRSLRLAGDLRLTFFPWLGVESGPLELGNAPGFGSEPFARLERARVRVRLLPLLRRELEMDTVSLEGLELNLERDASGRGNWEDLAGTAGAGTSAGNNGSPALAALAIGGIELRDATLRWDDERGGQRVKVSGLELKSGPIAPGRPLALELGFDLEHEAVSGRVEVRGEVELAPSGQEVTVRGLALSARLRGPALGEGEARIEAGGDARYALAGQRLRVERLRVEGDATLAGTRVRATLEGLLAGDLAAGPRLELRNGDARITLEGEALPGGQIEARLAATLRADLGAGTLTAPGLKVALEPLELEGMRLAGLELGGDLAARLDGSQVAVESLAARAEASGGALGEGSAQLKLGGRLLAEGERLRAPGLTVTADLAGLLPGEPLAVAARTDLAVDLAARRATLTALEASAAGVKASGDLVLDAAAASVTGKLAVKPFAPRALLTRLGVAVPATADPKALALASLSTGVTASAAGVRLEDLDLRLDRSRIRGSLELPRAAAEGRRLRFDLSVDRLALDGYLPPAAAGPQGAAPAGGGAAVLPGAEGALATLPLETLRSLDLEGRLRVGELTVRGARLRKLDVPLRAGGGLVQLGKASARLYGGRLESEVSLDARGKALALSADKRLADVDAAALLAALGLDPAALGLAKDARLDLSGRVRLSAGEQARKVAVETLEVSGRLRGKGLPKAGVELAAKLGGRVDLDQQTVTVPELSVRLDGAEVSGKLAMTEILKAPRYAGTLEVAPFDPRALLAALGRKPPPTADPKALTRASLKATVSGGPSGLRAEGIELALDETRVSGVFEITDLRAPGYRFDLDVDRIDADRYLPPRQPGAKPAATPGAAAAALPLEALRRLDLAGEVRIGELRIAGLRLAKVRFAAKAGDGKLRLNPLEASLYQGRYQGDIRVDASRRPPRLSADERLRGVQIGPLLEDLQGRALLSGRGDLTLRASARGAEVEALKRTLDGRAEFRFTDGAIYGVDILGSLCRALSVAGAAGGGALGRNALISGVLGLAGQAIGGQARPRDRTEFAELAGTVDVRRGLATNRDLVLRSPLVRVEGAGEADLARDRIRYTVEAALVASCRGQGGPDLRELRGLPIPVRLTGRLSAPTIQWPGPQEVIAAVRRLRRSPQPVPAAQAAPPAAPSQVPSAQAPPPAPSPRDVGKQAIEQLLQKGLKGLFGQ